MRLGASGKSLNGRSGLTAALAAVEAGEADGLVVAKLDRLSRSLLDFAGLMERSQRKGWSLVALDLGVDTSTPSGEMMASVLAIFAQFERRLIGQRTREALAVKRAQGVRLGRPATMPDAVRARIRAEHEGGQSLAAIAAGLNAAGCRQRRAGSAGSQAQCRLPCAPRPLDRSAGWPTLAGRDGRRIGRGRKWLHILIRGDIVRPAGGRG